MLARPHSLRPFLLRVLQFVGTTVVFAIFNLIARRFIVDAEISVFYPATAVDVLAVMWFGWAGALGVFVGTLITPWNPSDHISTLAVVGLLNVLQGAIPAVVFHVRRDLHADLRDLRSYSAFLLFGAVLNSAIFALLGNVLLILQPGEPLLWRQLFIWWISDFSGVLLIAVPIMVFATPFRLRGSSALRHRRSLTDALKIAGATVLLGWVASTSIRSYVLGSFEGEVSRRERAWGSAEQALTRIERTTAEIAASSPAPGPPLVGGRYASRVAAELQELQNRCAPLTHAPAAMAELRALQDSAFGTPLSRMPLRTLNQELLDVREKLDHGHRESAEEFSRRRVRVGTVATLMDLLLFSILGLAFFDIIRGMSRPLRLLHMEVDALKQGKSFQAPRVESSFEEIDSLAETLHETTMALAERERELQVQTARAIDASRHKTDFLARMSHELRTPLNSIVGFSELLIERNADLEPEKRRGFLENVWRSGTNLLRLINDLLDLAKVEAGKMSFEYDDVDLRQIVQASVASVAPLFSRKKQQLVVMITDEPMRFRADAGRMEQVLLNLLANANKYSDENTRVTVRAECTAEAFELSVSDEGMGISEADQQRIFEDFEQVTVPATPAEGTGLGLALARRFVEAHGGWIEVDSAVGVGSTFCIKLPRGKLKVES